MQQIPSLFELNTIIVNEKVNLLKFSNEYKLENEQGELVGMVKQHVPLWEKVASLIVKRIFFPFELYIEDTNERKLATIKRGWTFLFSKVSILDQHEQLLGHFQARFKLFGSKFDIVDTAGNTVGRIEGNWSGWDFHIFDANGDEIGTINKKWNGAMKELFTTADRYKVEIAERVAEDNKKILLLSVAITIDMILKESH